MVAGVNGVAAHRKKPRPHKRRKSVEIPLLNLIACQSAACQDYKTALAAMVNSCAGKRKCLESILGEIKDTLPQ